MSERGRNEQAQETNELSIDESKGAVVIQTTGIPDGYVPPSMSLEVPATDQGSTTATTSAGDQD